MGQLVGHDGVEFLIRQLANPERQAKLAHAKYEGRLDFIGKGHRYECAFRSGERGAHAPVATLPCAVLETQAQPHVRRHQHGHPDCRERAPCNDENGHDVRSARKCGMRCECHLDVRSARLRRHEQRLAG